MNFSLYIAKRYLFSKSSNNAINIITLIASFGIVVGSMALFIILSGFSGLRTFSTSLLDYSDPDIKITSEKGKSFLFNNSIKNILESESSVIHYSKVLEERVFLKNGDKEYIAYMKGVDTNYNKITKIDSVLVLGNWLDSDFLNTAVIGDGISHKLSLGVLNYREAMEIYVPKAGKGIVGSNSYRNISTKIVGIYRGTEEFQNKFVFVPVETAQSLLRFSDNQFTAIELKLDTEANADEIVKTLQSKLGSTYKIQTRAQLNELFYKVINTENFVSYLIFTLIVIIAMFNVVGTIIMMILDKKQNLNTLLNLGATLKEVKRIFVLQGSLLTFFGMLIGLCFAIVLIVIQQKFELFMLTSTIPYPVEFKISNLLVAIATILCLGFFASLVGSSRISRDIVSQRFLKG